MDGRVIGAIFNTPGSMFPKARATGNFTLRENALAREILVDKEGLARAVSIRGHPDSQGNMQVKARIVVVCASTVESARLLLNSRSSQHPGGIANSNGIVGKYLHGHLGQPQVSIYLEELQGKKPSNQDGATDHVYIPRYNHLSGKSDVAGGWGMQVNFQSYMFPHHAHRLRDTEVRLNRTCGRCSRDICKWASFAKVTAGPENQAIVDPARSDANGIPIPRGTFPLHQNDQALWKQANQSMLEMFSHLKGKVFSTFGDAPQALRATR